MLCIKCMYFPPQWKVLTFKCVFVFGHATKSQNNTGSLVMYSLFMHLELRTDIMRASMQHYSKRNVEQNLISILANDDFTVCRLEVGRFVLYKRVHLRYPFKTVFLSIGISWKRSATVGKIQLRVLHPRIVTWWDAPMRTSKPNSVVPQRGERRSWWDGVRQSEGE